MHRPIARILAATGKLGTFAALAIATMTTSARAEAAHGAVYALTNAAANSVAVYQRWSSGVLSPAGTYLTGGQGTGAGLGSQGAIALSEDGRWLAAVKAASNDVTVFSVNESGLIFHSRTASGGHTPVSVTIHDGVFFVVNAGGTPNISGFRLHRTGEVEMIPGSSLPLTGKAPAQISFSPDGEVLAVTEKASNIIDIFLVDNGVPSLPTSVVSNGLTPFGFAFDKRDHLIVSEAFGGAPAASAVSSYGVSEEGNLSLITGSLKNGQAAVCWIAVTSNGKFAFAANTGSSSITGHAVSRDGVLTQLSADGVSAALSAGSVPTDLAISRNDRFLYVLNSGHGSIGAYRIAPNGSLGLVGNIAGLPSGSVGLAARWPKRRVYNPGAPAEVGGGARLQ